MNREAGDTAGIRLIAVFVGINGVASLADAYFGLRYGEKVTAIFPFIIGLFLVHRAYGIWIRKHRAWLVTILLLALRAMFSLWNLILFPNSMATWLDLAIAAATILYLLHPRVRRLFATKRAGS